MIQLIEPFTFTLSFVNVINFVTLISKSVDTILLFYFVIFFLKILTEIKLIFCDFSGKQYPGVKVK